MPSVSVRELKNKATSVLREVREKRAEYVVTFRGRPVAVILPIDEQWLDAVTERTIEEMTPGADAWAELEALRQEISKHWRTEKSAVDLIAEQRR